MGGGVSTIDWRSWVREVEYRGDGRREADIIDIGRYADGIY
jgi:hypothetical protein